jgi:hypothetical protein
MTKPNRITTEPCGDTIINLQKDSDPVYNSAGILRVKPDGSCSLWFDDRPCAEFTLADFVDWARHRNAPPAEPPRQVVWVKEVRLLHEPHTFCHYDLCTPEGVTVKLPYDMKTVESIQGIVDRLCLGAEVRVWEPPKPATCPHGRAICPDCTREASE